ncbi:MAG: ethylbenzene dehydrogenase-related protein [Candidatus Thorarchaeota archaeon]|nr:ethylbenzene dehydrogenase-related protein [Candidatus Thorarchaeota archaeon]
MKTKKIIGVLVALGFFVTVLFASQNVIALSDGVTLSAMSTTDTITLDGEKNELAWNDAEMLIIPSIDGSGIDVELQALNDGTYIYIFASWNDSTKDDTRRGWSFNGTDWSNVGGNEDRIEFAWSLGTSIVCGHNPGTADPMLFDVWHWKASRTGISGWADDRYWDGSGRHSDDKTSGGFFDNSVVRQGANSSAITAALGNSTSVAAFSNNDRPFWDNNGVEITWTAGVNATPVGNFINGYKSVIPVGSQGDVPAASVHNGTAWNIEFKRALDTGNDDDVAFSDSSSMPFYVAIHNNSGDDNHFRAGGSSPTTFQLSIESATTSTTTTTSTTPTAPPFGLDQTLLIGAAVVGILAVFIIVAFVRRGR